MKDKPADHRTFHLVIGLLAIAGLLLLIVAGVAAWFAWHWLVPAPVEARDTMLRGDEIAYTSITFRPDDAALAELLHRAYSRALRTAEQAPGFDPDTLALLQTVQVRQMLPLRIESATVPDVSDDLAAAQVVRVSLSTGARLITFGTERYLRQVVTRDPQASMLDVAGRKMFVLQTDGWPFGVSVDGSHILFGAAPALEAHLQRPEPQEDGLPASIATMHEEVRAGDASIWGHTILAMELVGSLVQLQPPRPPLRPDDDLQVASTLRFLCFAADLKTSDRLAVRIAILTDNDAPPDLGGARRIADLLGRGLEGLAPTLVVELAPTRVEENFLVLEGGISGLLDTLGLADEDLGAPRPPVTGSAGPG